MNSAQIFLIFLRLGCISFGGPVAHLGFFREEFVRRRKWLDDATYADLIALCQFFPGPASSQTGFAIGYRKGGVAGAFAAWLGFTLPSAILMIAFALSLGVLDPSPGSGWLQGLKVAAAAVVAKAVWSMAVKLCPDVTRATLAVLAAILMILFPLAWLQVALILGGGVVGYAALTHRLQKPGPSDSEEAIARPQSVRRIGWVPGSLLICFVVLLVGLPVIAPLVDSFALRVFELFYRAGSLVFGGGHVVLPLLESTVVEGGLVNREAFLSGYGAAQAVPGPLFTFAAFLGSAIEDPHGWPLWLLGIWALIGIYLPSWLLVLGGLPYWERIRNMKGAAGALAGTNAVVVGLLLAAFYDPVLSGALTSSRSAALGLLAFAALQFWKAPPWAVVLLAAGLGYVAL